MTDSKYDNSISDVTKVGGKISFTLDHPIYGKPPKHSWGRHFTRVIKGYRDLYADKQNFRVAVVVIGRQEYEVQLSQITRIWKDGEKAPPAPPRSASGPAPRDEWGRFQNRTPAVYPKVNRVRGIMASEPPIEDEADKIPYEAIEEGTLPKPTIIDLESPEMTKRFPELPIDKGYAGRKKAHPVHPAMWLLLGLVVVVLGMMAALHATAP